MTYDFLFLLGAVTSDGAWMKGNCALIISGVNWTTSSSFSSSLLS